MELTSNQIAKQIKNFEEIQPWNHNFRLPNGLETKPGMQVSHGKNEIKWKRIAPIIELINIKDKKVLDVGCNEGFFTQKMSESGAEVLGIDIDKNRVEKANFIQEILKSPQTMIQQMDIYGDEFKALPRFDFCLCMGFLHRVPDPFSAIKKLTEKTDMILFEWKALKFGPHNESFAYYTPGDFDHQDFYGTPYWLLSYRCVEEMLTRLGFKHFYRVDDPKFKRAILVAGRTEHLIFKSKPRIDSANKFVIVARHTKRFCKTLKAILKGEINS